MKIAVFVEYFPPRLGSDRRIYELMRRLSSKHEIHFIAVPPFRLLCGRLSAREGPLNRYLKGKDSGGIREGIIAHFIQIPNVIFKFWRRSYEVGYLLTLTFLLPKVIRAVRKINPEVMVLNYPGVYTGFLGFAAGKLLGKFVLVDFNDLIAQYTINFLELKKSSLMAKAIRFIQDFIVKNCEQVIATTNFIKEYALGLGVRSEDVSVIPNGVDVDIFDLTRYDGNLKRKFSFDGKRLCIYCGRLDKWAGMNIIIKLSTMFKQKRPDVKFLVVGEGEKIGWVFEENMVVMGELPNDRVPEALAAADVILVPFPENDVSHAASPLKLFEGMAMGKPVIASRVSGIEDIVVHFKNGMLADSNNINEWSEALLFLLNSTSFAKEMGERARATVEERYDWKHLAEQFEKAIIHQENRH